MTQRLDILDRHHDALSNDAELINDILSTPVPMIISGTPKGRGNGGRDNVA
jgi:hypothetical protein